MSWVILPCLFVYLFVGVVLAAWSDEYHNDKTDDSSALVAILWPIIIVTGSIVLLRYLIKKVRTFL